MWCSGSLFLINLAVVQLNSNGLSWVLDTKFNVMQETTHDNAQPDPLTQTHGIATKQKKV